MKITKRFAIWPMSLGLDKTSIPGTQNPAALSEAKNIFIGARPSLRKRPGLVKIQYIGDNDGVQNAIQYNGTLGGGKVSQIVRVRKGKLEVMQDIDGTGMEFNEVLINDGSGGMTSLNCHPTDNVVFEQFANALLIAMDNRAPVRYIIGQGAYNLAVRSTHIANPPRFMRKHDFRLFYGGMGNDRDRLFFSAVNNIENYSLFGGGGAIRFNDGDGDIEGLTGISPTFRGNLYVYKWNQIYRMYYTNYGYAIDQLTNEAGAINQNCIIATQNDVFSVDVGGIRSLSLTDKYGAADTNTLTWPIYDYFQEEVNWSAFQNFRLSYDKQNATLLFAYTSNNSMVNDRVLGMNLRTNQFFEWDDCAYPAIDRCYSNRRQTIFVHDTKRGACVLDIKTNTLAGDKIGVDIKTGIIFPFGEPKNEFTIVKGWLLARPTTKSVKVTIEYALDSKFPNSVEIDLYKTPQGFPNGYGSIINDKYPGGFIGTDLIGRMPQDMGSYPIECQGDGSSFEFRIKHLPPDNDPDQSLEIYGILLDLDYNEDNAEKTTV